MLFVVGPVNVGSPEKSPRAAIAGLALVATIVAATPVSTALLSTRFAFAPRVMVASCMGNLSLEDAVERRGSSASNCGVFDGGWCVRAPTLLRTGAGAPLVVLSRASCGDDCPATAPRSSS
jgi:hypothetical protein